MKKLQLRSKIKNEFLEVPVDFIDVYMPSAPADYVKVYLYLLRVSIDPSILLSLNDMADLFDVTPNKISQSLQYWAGEGLLSLEFSDNEISDITLLPYPSKASFVSENAPAVSVPVLPEDAEAPAAEPTEVRIAAPERIAPAVNAPMDLHALDHDDEFANLLELTEFYMKKPITSTQRASLGFCYLLFDRQSDIIEYLLEYCIERGHFSFHYIEAVAKGWKNDGLTTLDAIREETSKRNENVYGIMNAFGLGSRMPVKDETDYIESWTRDFDLPIILEACSRTMSSIHTPSFKYADSILNSWKKNGVKDKNDIDALDRLRQSKGQKASAEKPVKKNNAFHNFEERSVDYNAMVANYYKR